MRGGKFWSVFECLLANCHTHFFWKIFIFLSRSLPSLHPSWGKILAEMTKKQQKRHFFHHVLTGNLQEQSKRGAVFHKKTTASNTLHFSFHPLDSPQTESRTHRTLSLNPPHQGPENRLYYEGFFLIYLKRGRGSKEKTDLFLLLRRGRVGTGICSLVLSNAVV